EISRQENCCQGGGEGRQAKGKDSEEVSGEEVRRQQEGEVTDAYTNSHHRHSDRHRADLGGVSGSWRIHVPRAPARDEAPEKKGGRAALQRVGDGCLDLQPPRQGSSRGSDGRSSAALEKSHS